jgi:ABC-type multidrug transport system fused ATPase/permease subunit
MPTPATDALLILFSALDEAEKQEVVERIATTRAIHAVGEASASTPFISSLRRVAEFIGHEPTVDEYKDACAALRERGEDIKGFSAVVRHFGTWRRAKEAMDLSTLTSIRNVEARFRHRRVNKIWRYSEETLRETLARVVEYYGGIPTIQEFDAWRQRELRLAAAEGNDAMQVPSTRPFRERYRGWEKTLLHFGYPPTEIAKRLERP